MNFWQLLYSMRDREATNDLISMSECGLNYCCVESRVPPECRTAGVLLSLSLAFLHRRRGLAGHKKHSATTGSRKSECVEVSSLCSGPRRRFPALQRLNLSACQRAQDWELRGLAGLRELAELRLDGLDALTDAGVALLAPLAGQLTSLSLRNCSKVRISWLVGLRGCDVQSWEGLP